MKLGDFWRTKNVNEKRIKQIDRFLVFEILKLVANFGWLAITSQPFSFMFFQSFLLVFFQRVYVKNVEMCASEYLSAIPKSSAVFRIVKINFRHQHFADN